MNLTKTQKHVIDCVLSIFETGRVPTAASYSTCSILADGAGISYGKHQCTDKSGSLDLVVKKYIELGGQHASALQAYLPYLAANTSSTEPPKGPYKAETTNLINLLKTAGQDPKMQEAQDIVFDANYFAPALNHAKSVGAQHALTVLVIYDTCIHSGPGGVTMIRNKFAAKSPANGGDEKEWVKAYLNARRAWLAANANPLVQKTVYRMDALMEIVNAGNWDLNTPLKVRGVSIT
jgi:chitosanase